MENDVPVKKYAKKYLDMAHPPSNLISTDIRKVDLTPPVIFNLKCSSYSSLWKSAIHVDSSITWTLCADNLNYQTTVQDVSQYLHHALNQGTTF